MRKLLCVVSILFYTIIVDLNAQIFEASFIISKMQKHFEDKTGFRASFVEKNGDKIYRGHIIYKKPGKFKMTYIGGQTITYNGEYLWIYVPEAGIVSEQKVETNMGGFYTKDGVSRLKADYNFNFYNNIRELRSVNSFNEDELGIAEYTKIEGQNDTRKAYHMELTPKQASTDKTGFVKIHLWVNNSGMIIRAIGISTTQSIIEYVFTNINYYDIYNNDVFNFIIPPGMLVLKDELVD